MSAVSRYWIFGKTKIVDPGCLYRDSVHAGWQTEHFWGKANAFVCPRGEQPGYGWLLIRNDDTFDPNRLTDLYCCEDGIIVNTLKSLVVTKTEKAIPLVESYNTTYLIHVADVRHLLKKSAMNKDYNCRMMAPPGDSTGDTASAFYTQTLDSGSVWTWQTMITDIISKLPSGVCEITATLPFTPHGKPQDIKLDGVETWHALCLVLSKIQCEPCLNLNTNTITIQKIRDTQEGLQDLISEYRNRLRYSADPLDTIKGNIPEKFMVCFRRIPKHYGAQDDSPKDGNWAMSSVHTIEKTTGVTGVQANTKEILWDEMPAIVAPDNSTIANSSALDTRATERAANETLSRRVAANRSSYQYNAIIPFQVGSYVSRVIWRNFGDSDASITQVEFNGICRTYGIDEGYPTDVQKNNAELANYPHAVQWVKINDGESSDGDVVQADTYGFFEGSILRLEPGTSDVDTHELDDCYIYFTDNHEPSESTDKQGAIYLARYCGSIDNGSGYRPLLIVGTARSGGKVLLGQIDGTFSTGTNTVSIYSDVSTDTGEDKTAKPWFSHNPAGFMPIADDARVILFETEDGYYFIPVLDLTAIAGYDAAETQYLTHVSGVPTWKTRATC